MASSRLITGARVVLYVNGDIFAAVSEFKWASESPLRELYGIDSMQPYESSPTITKISGAMTIYRQLQDGGAEGAGIVATYRDLPREKYFSLVLVEKASDTIVFQARQCKVSSQSWDIPTKGFMIGNLSWTAIEWSNEVISTG